MSVKKILVFMIIMAITMSIVGGIAEEPLIKKVPVKEGIGSFPGIPLIYLQDAVHRSTHGHLLIHSKVCNESYSEILEKHFAETNCTNSWHLLTPDNEILELELDDYQKTASVYYMSDKSTARSPFFDPAIAHVFALQQM